MLSLLKIHRIGKNIISRRYFSTTLLNNASSYKVVIFDMGGVVLPSPFNAAYKWEKNHGFEKGTIFQAIKHNKNDGTWSKLERGEMSLEQFYSPFADEVCRILPSGKFVNAEMIEDFMNHLSDALSTPNEDMLEAIKNLKV